jgi:hypothetical protein
MEIREGKDHAVGQPASQPASQPTSQPASQPASQSASQSVKEDLSISQNHSPCALIRKDKCSDMTSSSYLLPKMPVNLFFGPAGPAAALLREALTADDERSKLAAGPPTLSSNRSQGATSALRGVGPVLAPIARREVGGRGQSMLEPTLGVTLGAMLGAILFGRRAARFALLYCE